MMNKYSGTLGDYSYQFLIGYISNYVEQATYQGNFQRINSL